MIPFNRPFVTGTQRDYVVKALESGHLSGDGAFTKLCSNWLESNLNVKRALLTNSCTSALEMAAILADIKPGDEIIMPSYTFVSSANAFVLRGGVPVFVDIRPDTLNIDEALIEEAITSKTKVILPVHYAGVACEMDTIMDIADRHKLLVVEDAAQAILSTYKGRPLGSIGDLGCLSFHETKNIQSGEGGALLINDQKMIERAEIIREKGTDRSRFHRGEVDKYTWQDIGSSFLPSEVTAALLFAQLENAINITKERLQIWSNYYKDFEALGLEDFLDLPSKNQIHNGHMFQVLLKEAANREQIILNLRALGVMSVSHYVPLHSSPKGEKSGRVSRGQLPVTESIANRLLRAPMHLSMKEKTREVAEAFSQVMSKIVGGKNGK